MIRATSILGPIAILAVLAGCARTVEVRPRAAGPTGGSTGAGAEVVFTGSGIQPAPPGWEVARLDDRLGVPPVGEVIPAAPSLLDARRLYINPRAADQVIFFSPYRW